VLPLKLKNRKNSQKSSLEVRIFYLFYKPSCPICENLFKSKAFQKFRRLLTKSDTIKLEVYNAEDGNVGEALADLLDVRFVPCLVDPMTGEKKRLSFRSLAELEASFSPIIGFVEEKEEKGKEKKKGVKTRQIYNTIVKYFPTQWFTPRDIKAKLPNYRMNTIRVAIHRLKERGELAYDPISKKYKLVT